VISFLETAQQAKLLVSDCLTSGVYAKRASAGNKKKRRGLLVIYFSACPSFDGQPTGLIPYFPGL
jgi:hypothetical protein